MKITGMIIGMFLMAVVAKSVAAPAIGIDVGDGVWDDIGEDNANGLQITATSFGILPNVAGETSVTVSNIKFTLNVGGAEYTGPYADRIEILGSSSARYTGPVPWKLEGLVPGGLYDMAFLMYNGRPGTFTVDGVGSVTPDADSDSNFEDVAANGLGVISGNWDYWTVGAWCSFTALLVEYTEVVVADTNAPTIAMLSPTNNATGVAPEADLAITFDEPVQKGSGDIVIKESGGSVFETIDVASVTVSGAVVTINPVSDLEYGTNYYVEIDSGAIKDIATTNNDFAGISGSATWSFTAELADTTAPTFTELSPTNNATGVAPNSGLAITFDEDVQKGSGDIVIKESGGSTFETIDVASANVTVSGAVVTIDPSSDLGYGTNYYVEIASGAVKDLGGPTPNDFTGIIGDSTWSFMTELPDTTAPTFTELSPANSATGVAPAGDLAITFDEPVQKGSGDIVIKEVGGSMFETIDVGSTKVTVSGTVVTINPAGDMDPLTEYYVEIASGAIEDVGEPTPNDFAGISGSSVWHFTTGKIPTVVSIDFDSGNTVYSGEVTHNEGITLPGQVGPWHKLSTLSAPSSITIPDGGPTFTLNTTGVAYNRYSHDPKLLRSDFVYVKDEVPIEWELTGLIPNATYDIICYGRYDPNYGGYRGGGMSVNGGPVQTKDNGKDTYAATAEGDWNFADVVADDTGKIYGTLSHVDDGFAEFAAIQFDKIADPIPSGTVIIVR